MSDRLGYRLKVGIVIPSTNTIVQPETDMMRPAGVTNHIGRIHLADLPLGNDTEFEAMVAAIWPDLLGSVDRVMTCKPDHLMMGMSIPTFWGGKQGGDRLQARLADQAGVPVTIGSDACVQALRRFPGVRRIGILTPYQKVGDDHVRRYFEECGFTVAVVHSLKRPSETQIAHATGRDIRAALRSIADCGVDAIVQAGTDLAVVDIAAEAERWLDLPVVAVNAASYWCSLRRSGITDQVPGLGRLMAEH